MYFIDINWLKIFQRAALGDEIEVKSKLKQKNGANLSLLGDIELVKSLYRQLKSNYEKNKNYGESEDFYYGEMEMGRLKLSKWRRVAFSWEGLYWLMSGYGQRWQRTFLWIIGCLLTFPLWFLGSGLNWEYSYKDSLIEKYLNAFQFNFWALTFQKEFNQYYKPEVFTKNLVVLETLLISILITLFIFALKRKFKR
ncbi:MAG: hypothetical protein HYV29_11790 [Ignavibacteriales bacterium]|nr:hypothetical protein [Ignavibacteriales bacterium]